MSVYVFEPVADGVIYGSSATYLTARSTATAVDPTQMTVGQQVGYSCFESFLSFDTSALGAAATIISAILTIDTWSFSVVTPFTNEVRVLDWGATLTVADWVAGASLGAVTPLVATFDADNAMGVGSKTFTDVAMAANVNKTGYTRLIINSDRHRAGSTPTNAEYVNWTSAEGENSWQNAPRLVVVTAQPPSAYLGGGLGRATVWNRALTAAEALADYDAGPTLYDRSLAKGSVVLKGTCRNRMGAPVPAHHVRAGWWIQNLETGSTKPLYITGHSIDLAAKKNALTIGQDWMEKEIGVRMAELLAIPATVVPDAATADAVDPWTPEPEPYVEDTTDDTTDDTYDTGLDPTPTPEHPFVPGERPMPKPRPRTL